MDRVTTVQRIRPCLWFDTEAEEAANFYVSLFEGSRILDVSRYGEAGPRPSGMVMMVSFELAGQQFLALNGGPEYRHTPAVSLMVSCETQEEVDRLWDAFLESGGSEVQCGWLTDRYGLSWQIVPAGFFELVGDPDPVRSQRSMRAMLEMRKLDINALAAAADG